MKKHSSFFWTAAFFLIACGVLLYIALVIYPQLAVMK